MASLSVFIAFILLCLMVPSSVLGDCEISPPTRCDLMYPEVVTEMSYNGTCPKKGTADLQIGSTYALNISFTPTEDAQYASSVVEVLLPMGIVIPVDLGNANACEGMGLTCPLKAFTSYTVNNVFTLANFPVYSTLNANIRWSLVDKPPSEGSPTYADRKFIFCIVVGAVVEPGPASVGAPEFGKHLTFNDASEGVPEAGQHPAFSDASEESPMVENDPQLNFRVVP